MSAFKQLYSSMINADGSFSDAQKGFSEKSGKLRTIKCFVKESFPHFLVTDNHYYVPCYFSKKAVDTFKSQHAGVNIVDLKSKVIEISDWSLDMAKVDSSSVFTSYAGIEIRLVVNGFKLVTGGKHQLTQYPGNLYRDDEMKTLFQAYHHRTLASRMAKGDSLPDVSKKASSVVSFGSGSAFQYPFKAGSAVTLTMASIFKSEKGQAAFTALQSNSSGPAGARVIAQVKKASKQSAKKSAVKSATKAITKGSGNNKKSVARLGGTSVPRVMTPKDKASAVQTPKMSKKSFASMTQYIKNKKK